MNFQPGALDSAGPAAWGLRPVLFRVAGVPVPSYEVFVTLALVAGALVFWLQARRDRTAGERTIFIVLAALVGGALGAKLLEWCFTWRAVAAHLDNWRFLLAGRTVIGGFVGGSLGVILVKRRLGITERRGNLFAPAIALGLAVGRVGCLLRGCCYGTETSLAWGVDFGDHVRRHPTQIYEIVFALVMFAVLLALRRRVTAPGQLLTVFMTSYLVFRFFEEFVRAGDRLPWGLTVYQIAAVAGLAYFAVKDRWVPRKDASHAIE